MTLVLRHEDIVDLLTPDEVREAVEAGFMEQATGQVQLPPRTTIDSTSSRGWLRVMPTILNGSGVMGFKSMHSTPGVGVGYLVMLYELSSGDLLAQMDADWLTAQRTAATAAIAANALAKAEVDHIGVLGSSEQARAMLAAVCRVRMPKQVSIYSPTPANRLRFSKDMSKCLGVTISPVGTPCEAVSDCDLIVSVFRAGVEPLIQADWIGPGSHLSAGSSIRPEARELANDVWRHCAVIAVDDRGHVFESGDGRSAIASQAIGPEHTIELWELLSGKRSGRQRKEDITLFKGVGTALQDIALANAIYQKAKAQGLGQDIGRFPRVRR